MLEYIEGRYLVPDKYDKDVFPDEWIEAYGRLALPACWTPELWHRQDKAVKRFVYRACTHFPFFLHQVYLPFKSYNEGEKWPDRLPDFLYEYALLLEKMVPLELLPFERKPASTNKWQLCVVFPTDHFKSSSTCEAFPLWLMGLNPSVTIVAAVATKEKGERFITATKAHVERNDRFTFVFDSYIAPIIRVLGVVMLCAYCGLLIGRRLHTRL